MPALIFLYIYIKNKTKTKTKKQKKKKKEKKQTLKVSLSETTGPWPTSKIIQAIMIQNMVARGRSLKL